MVIPAEDSAALMEGMILHRQGLACVARASAGAGPTAASAAAAAAAKGGETRSAQKKKARHPPLPPQEGKTPSVGEAPGAIATPTSLSPTATVTTTATTDGGSAGKGAEGSLDDGTGKEACQSSCGGRSDREEGGARGAPEEKGEGRVPEQGGDMQVEDDAQDLGTPSAEGTVGRDGDAAMSDERNMGDGISGHDAAYGGRGGSKGVPKGKGRLKPGERARYHVDTFFVFGTR